MDHLEEKELSQVANSRIFCNKICILTFPKFVRYLEKKKKLINYWPSCNPQQTEVTGPRQNVLSQLHEFHKSGSTMWMEVRDKVYWYGFCNDIFQYH